MIGPHTLFDHTDYRNFLSTFFKEKKRQNKNFSLRLWATKLGLKSPSALSMVLNGERHPGAEFTDQLIEYFTFSNKEAKYFRNLIKLSKINGDTGKRAKILNELKQIHPDRNFHHLEADIFNSMSNWYFFTIRELVQLEDFKENPDWISTRLNKKVSPQEVKRAIQTMLRLGLLKRDPKKKLIQANQQIITSTDVSSEALKQFHEEMILLAHQAIRTMPLNQREITSVTLNIAPRSMQQAKELIREFRIRFTELMEVKPGKETFQLNIQFFPLTNLKNGGMKHETTH